MKVGANLVEIYRKQSCSIKILIVLNTSTAKTIASNLGKNTALEPFLMTFVSPFMACFILGLSMEPSKLKLCKKRNLLVL